MSVLLLQFQTFHYDYGEISENVNPVALLKVSERVNRV